MQDRYDMYLEYFWGLGFGYQNHGAAKMIIFLCFMFVWIKKDEE